MEDPNKKLNKYKRGSFMSIKKRYISLAIASLLSSQSYAAGFQVSNPAAMTHFKQAEFSGALSVINPSIDIYDHTWDQGAEDVAPIAFVPAGYYVHPVNDQLAVGSSGKNFSSHC